ncbi:MAG: 3-octaprenyl-4-hydroxybenzoate carboxy-lyase, partial [Saprospiraceae bacterium]|nr:3-octaprenyl-4-hydroxybenzoate carboxy-lyase [Saprospiraceae bacterium]
IDKIYHRRNPLWHFTVVGRPPQEDSGFGYLIHQLVGPLLPSEFPGIKELHAVDVAGVHPLLLAIGSERYMPFRQSQPEEILTQANHLLGSGQTSLAKYLWIAAADDDPHWSTSDIPGFFRHMLERVDWKRDLHFQTRTTIDTLDYSGSGWNAGSKLVVAVCGEKIRSLATEIESSLRLPQTCKTAELIDPGILVVEHKSFEDYGTTQNEIEELTSTLEKQNMSGFPLIVLVDDATFVSRNYENFLWVTFTRSNPSHDIYGVESFFENKHWGCRGPLIIDARIKPHHAPVLEVDRETTLKVDQLFAKGGSLHGLGT